VSDRDIRVLGLGNVLMGDDGFGPFVVEALAAAYELPPNVSVIDLGTPGLDLTPFLSDADVAIIVDTIRAEGSPGDLHLYRRKDLFKHGPPMRLGPHDPGLAQALLTLEFAGCAPREVLLVGVIPQTTAPGGRLTPTLRRAVPHAMRSIVAELESLGVSLARRPSVLPVKPWWERVA
jgi:hydrogenase maturation protease